MSKRKLSDDDVRMIRQLDQERAKHRKIADSLSRKAIAEKFGMSPSRIWDICAGYAYKNVE